MGAVIIAVCFNPNSSLQDKTNSPHPQPPLSFLFYPLQLGSFKNHRASSTEQKHRGRVGVC